MGLWRALLDLLYPPRCVFCRQLMEGGPPLICPRCRNLIPRTGLSGERYGPVFKRCVSPLFYEGEVRASILRFKFGGAAAYAETYGILVSDCIRQNLAGEYDLITWIPLSRKRLRQRGFDQARLIAEAAAAALGEKAVPLLEKCRETPRQSTMAAASNRKRNVSGAYRVPEPGRAAGQRILLIDDIVTTGSTLGECSRTLKEAGAAEVVCAVLAAVRR